MTDFIDNLKFAPLLYQSVSCADPYTRFVDFASNLFSRIWGRPDYKL
jgi:hypothetical protein